MKVKEMPNLSAPSVVIIGNTKNLTTMYVFEPELSMFSKNLFSPTSVNLFGNSPCNNSGWGVKLFIRGDILAKLIGSEKRRIGGYYVEMNLRKHKLFLHFQQIYGRPTCGGLK